MHSTTMWVHRPQQRTSLVTRQQRIVTSMETQRALLPRQQTSLEIQRPRIVTATGIPSVHRPRPRISLEIQQRRIGTVMATQLEQRDRARTFLAIRTPLTRIPMDVRQAHQRLLQISLERQRPRIVTGMVRPLAPQRPLRTSLAPEVPSSVETPATRLSGRGRIGDLRNYGDTEERMPKDVSDVEGADTCHQAFTASNSFSITTSAYISVGADVGVSY